MLPGSLDLAVAYLSDQAHSAVERALRVIGLRPEQIRRIASDQQFRLPVNSLAAAVAQDRRAGLQPFCVIANAGTTNSGAVDPLDELADLCASESLWLHADGAYGAAAVICERGRAALRGLGRVDSLALDPHKWLFQPFECGCVLVRDVARLKAAFRVMPEYLRDVHRGEEEIHPCDYGIQLTRGFRALKLWYSLKTFGMTAFRNAVSRGFELAELAESELRTYPDCRIVSPAQMAIVCFRFGEGEAAQTNVVEGMLRDGYAFLTSTKLHDEACLRLCTINPRTTEGDIRETIRRIAVLARASDR
jgi:glutamate/tyrosine decarboxylase-like PLP-dependent enzyme